MLYWKWIISILDINTVDFKRVDLNLLVSLDVLLTERNVTRAAERLHLSQPALSAQLARLREAFDDPLLLPAARGMVPTARGLELAAPLKTALADLEKAVTERASFDTARANHTFRIIATDYAQLVVLIPFAEALRQEAPGIRLAWMTPNLAQIDKHLEAGIADLALVTPAAAPRDARTRVLFEERFVCVLRKRHPLARKPLSLDAFCELDHVLVSPTGGGFLGAVDEALAQMGRKRRVVVSAPEFLIVPPLLARSDMVATLPERVARAFEAHLAILELPLALPGFTLLAAWHPRNHNDSAHQWLRERLAHHGQQA